jgi:hypothetical protein
VVHAWSEAFGSAGDDYGLAVAVDPSGNVYVTGSFEGTVAFGGPALTSAGASDAFVVSLTSAGAHRWSQRFGDSGIDQGIDVAVDPTGNVYLTGAFSGTASFGGAALTSAGASDAFVASLTTAGAHRWSAGFGAATDDSGNGVAVDSSGNVTATGSFQGTASFGGTVLISAGAGDIFVASFTTSGTHRWSKRAGDTNDDAGFGIAADGAGNVYATGAFEGSADLGGGALAGAGKQDIFVASWTALGAHRWSTGFGSNQDDAGLAAATDTVGNLFVAGWFQSSMSLGANNLSSAGAEDIFIASFTTAGAHRWSKSFGSTHEDMGQGVATDAQGNLCVAGYFHQTIDFGGGPLSSNGGRDIFVADYTTTGAHRWSNSYGSTTGISNDLGFDCAVDSAGNVYVVGVFRYPIDLGGGSLSNSGGNDAFLLKLAP